MSDPLGLIGNTPAIRRDFSAPGGQPNLQGGAGSFKELLEQQISQVNELQQDAKVAVEDIASGRRDDLEGVIIATQKADTAFRMLLAVRNKMMDAYSEVKDMRV